MKSIFHPIKNQTSPTFFLTLILQRSDKVIFFLEIWKIKIKNSASENWTIKIQMILPEDSKYF